MNRSFLTLSFLIWGISLSTPAGAIKQNDKLPVPGIPEAITDLIQQNSWIGWIFWSFCLCAALITAVATFTDNFKKVRRNIFGKQPTNAEIDERLLKVKKKLSAQLHNEYSTRINESGFNLSRIGLPFQKTQQKVEDYYIALVPEDKASSLSRKFKNRILHIFQKQSFKETTPKNIESITDIFDSPDIRGRLLILGAPGAGKTTELLTFSKERLKQSTDTTPIPIIFELSEWDGSPIEEWVAIQLDRKYNISSRITKKLLTRNILLPLFDGLDELAVSRQEKCVQTLNLFLDSDTAIKTIICCRLEEYDRLGIQLSSLNAAVCMQPLNKEDIRLALGDWNRSSIWKNIHNKQELITLAQSPLFLSMLAVSYEGRKINNANELFEAYIRKNITLSNTARKNSLQVEKDLKHLTYLANTLETEQKTEFLIENIQPTHLPNNIHYRWYLLSAKLIGGVIYGLIIASTHSIFSIPQVLLLNQPIASWASVIDGIKSGLAFGVALGTLRPTLAGFLFGFTYLFAAILLQDNEQWKYAVIESLVSGFVVFWSSGLSVTLEKVVPIETIKLSWSGILPKAITLSVTGLLLSASISSTGELISQSPFNLRSVIAITLIGGFLGGVIGTFIGGITDSPQKVQASQPNQAIRKSALNSLFITLYTSISTGLVAAMIIGGTGGYLMGSNSIIPGLMIGITGGSLLGIRYGLLIAMRRGGIACIQHLALRCILYFSGTMPWNYRRFLTRATRYRLIQGVGGRYRFIHELLKKYLSSINQDDVQKILGKS